MRALTTERAHVRRGLVFLFSTLVLAVPVIARAQAAVDVAGFRTFATWPDDAEVLDKGSGVLSVGVSNWHWALGRGIAVPSLFGSVGLGRRLQFGVTIESDRSTYTDATHQTSLGDVYLIGKIGVVDPRTHRIGVAISPLVHVLSPDGLTYYRYYRSGTMRRAQFGLPVHVQIPAGRARVSVSGGVFSVGSAFVSGGADASINSRLSVNGTISQAFATGTALVDNPDVSRRRSDVSGGASLSLSPAVVLFGSIGRTISSTDQNSLTLLGNFGVAVFFGRRTP